MRGRKRKPDAVKALEGNPGKRKRTPDAAALPEGVTVAPVEGPEPPAHLSAEAQAEWRRIAPEMTRLGLLRKLDMGAFEERCELYATLRRCHAVIAKDGATYEHKGLTRMRPEVRLAQDCARQIRAYDSEFGLTPAARARVAHVTGEQPTPPKQPPLPGIDPPPADPAHPQPQPSIDDIPDEQFFRGPPN